MKITCFFIFSISLSSFTYSQNKTNKHNTEFTCLKEAMAVHPDSVIKLDLSKQNLMYFPEEIFMFTNLQQLYLNRNRISEIPDNISNLKHLTELNISKNNISSYLAVTIFEKVLISRFKVVNRFSKILKLNQNKITALPVSFDNMTRLEVIELYSNPLDFNPDQFSQFKKNLKKLDVRNTTVSAEHCRLLYNLLPETKVKCNKGCNCLKK